jgi:hypothetical protein
MFRLIIKKGEEKQKQENKGEEKRNCDQLNYRKAIDN